MATIDQLLKEASEKKHKSKWGFGKKSTSDAMLRSEKHHLPGAGATVINEATFGLSKKIPGMKKAEDELKEKSSGLHAGMQGVGILMSAPGAGSVVKIAGKSGKIGKVLKSAESALDKGSKVAQGAKKGGLWGIMYGSGQALGEGRHKDIINDALSGLASGAVLGGVGSKLADTITHITPKARKAYKYNKFIKEVSKDMTKAQKEKFLLNTPGKGSSIVDDAESKLLQSVKNITEKDNKALDLAKKARERVIGSHASDLEDLVEKHIHPGHSLKKHIEDVSEAVTKDTRPIYEKLNKSRVAIEGSYKDNPVFKRYVRKAQSQLGIKDPTDFRVLDQAKKLMQGDAYSVGRNPAEKQVLKNLEHQLREEVSAKHPEYSEALGKERHNIKVRKAGEHGQKYTKHTPNDIYDSVAPMTQDERKAMRLGAKESLKDRIATKKGNSANVADIFDTSEAKRLAKFLDGGASNNLVKDARAVGKKVRNFKEIGGGNPLVESQKMSDIGRQAVRWKRSLWRKIGKTVDKGIDTLNPSLESSKKMKYVLSGRGLNKMNKLMSSKKQHKLLLKGVGSPASLATAIIKFSHKS